MTIAATLDDADVLAHVAAEVDSIKIDTTVKDVAYKPAAWTRQGYVD